MNGVVIDDEPIHQESWRDICKKHDLHIEEDEFKHNVFGRTEKATLEYLFKREIAEEELEKLSTERVDAVIAIFKPQLEIMGGLDKLLETFKGQNIPMAIATSSRKKYTDFILDGLKIREYFSTVVTAQDIVKGKPDPEIYLKAASLLNVVPANCIVFEDTISGIESAHAAGMKVIAIATTHNKEELGIADKVIESFKEADLLMLNSV